MRAFWTLIAVFVLAAAGLVVSKLRTGAERDKAIDAQTKAQEARDLAKARESALSSKMRSASDPGEALIVAPTPGSAPAKAATPEATPAPELALSTKDLIDQTATVSATLFVRDREGKDIARGVGFLIASDLVVTTGAMLRSAHAVEVHVGSLGVQSALGTVAEDVARDLVFVKLSQPVPQVQALRLSTSDPVTGQEVVVVARGTGPEPMVSTGTLAAVAEDGTLGRVLTLSISGAPLTPGAAVLNTAGAVIGVVSEPVMKAKGAMSVLASQGLAAIPRHVLTPFGMYASAHKKPEERPGATPEASPTPSGTSDAKLTKRDDGSLLVDDRFVVKGDGTKEKPYEVTWEQLISAQDTYDPRSGKKNLPGRVTMLDGKYVRLTGYVAFPLYVDQPTELLSMLNQWDGCCIGVPPTPYDAVEVKLTGTVTKDQKLTTYGVVEGKLSVKPYLVGEWLVGLYLMDEAKLTTKQFGGFGS